MPWSSSDSILAVGISGGTVLHVAAHPKVGRQSDQRDSYGAQGQDQEQPDHPHDVLGYQKEVQCAWEQTGVGTTDQQRSGVKNKAQGASLGKCGNDPAPKG
jgi:hypothetical protein